MPSRCSSRLALCQAEPLLFKTISLTRINFPSFSSRTSDVSFPSHFCTWTSLPPSSVTLDCRERARPAVTLLPGVSWLLGALSLGGDDAGCPCAHPGASWGSGTGCGCHSRGAHLAASLLTLSARFGTGRILLCLLAGSRPRLPPR